MRVDLNADVGEECGDDAALIPLLTSANVACGGHAGDVAVMRRTVGLCVQNRVRVGAHVSYPDRENFGRKDMQMPLAELRAELLRQLEALDAVARSSAARITHLKAHGALYNRMADDATVADTVLAALKSFDPQLRLLTLPRSVAMERARAAGVDTVGEGFADRAYGEDGHLQPRGEAGAVITDPRQVAARGLRLAREGRVVSVSGKDLALEIRSLCVHGDTPGAVELARALRTALLDAGVELRAFT